MGERIFGGVGLGTFPFSGPFSSLSERKKRKILDDYFALGGKYLDTAPTYGLGSVETFLGDYLADKPRNSFAISTSAGFVMDEATGTVRVSGKPDDILRELEHTLRRLRLDYIDIYISHTPDPDTPKRETARALDGIRSQGLARRIGVSNVNLEQLRDYAEGADLNVVQNRFSYLNRCLSPDMLAFCEARSIAIVAYQVIERGHLTNRGVKLSRLGSGDLRRRKPEFRDDRIALVTRLVRRHVRPIARSAGMSIEELMIRWTLHQPAIGLAQVGATARRQIRALPLLDQSLSETQLARLEQAYSDMDRDIRGLGFEGFRDLLGLDEPTVQSATGR